MRFFGLSYSKIKFRRNSLVRIPFFKFCSHSENIVIGIETSCDDTGCAIINSSGRILGETLFSQNVTHLRYGGVNPLIARDLHRDNIELAVKETLGKAQLSMKDIDAIAVTVKPGLLFSLQIGVKFAMHLSKSHQKPIIPIHHMEAHALAARMCHNIDFPFLALLISGGHCLLTLVRGVDDFLLLGETLDNAPGEVLDKVARRMKLRNIPEYSQLAGGRAVELAAQKSMNKDLFSFPLPLYKIRDCNFSFSGLKDAFIRHLLNKESEHCIQGDEIIPEVNDLCAGFQMAIARHLVHRTERAVQFCENHNYLPKANKSIVVSGGVACNNFIFECLESLRSIGCNIFRPPPRLCTDNGIMIAWNGIEKLKTGYTPTNFTLNEIDPVAPLGINIKNNVVNANIHVKSTRLKNVLKY
ncbi:unnamed protein product [Colias eurytheme]|nr:unnamed protein product [Colias eurytheme]